MSYLKKRGIDNLEVIEKFQLGFSDRSLGNHLPESQSKEGKVLRPKLKEAGLYNKNGHEFMVGRITFPIFDDQKNVHNLYGRLINSPSRNTAKHVYLGSHKYFWNSEALDHPSKTLILCESIIDALSFYCHGYHNVTCAYGVNGLPEPMLNTLIKKGIKKIYIAYDGDEAGDKASNTLAEKLLGEGMECHRLHFPLNEDPNSFIRQVLTKGETTPQKALEILLNTSEWLGKTKPQTPTQTTLDTSPKESPSSFLAAETPAELNQLLTNISCIQKGSDYHLTLGSNSETRHYRVRGLHKNSTLDTLKVSLRLQHKEAMYLDTFDFYFNKFKETYIVKSANETGLKEDILKRDLGRIMLKLEQLQEERLAKKEETKAHSMSEKERKEALAFAKSPDLMKQILHHLTHCGHYGENYKKLFSYLATTSRLMQQPLSVLIQGSSGSGKTELMKSVLKFMPSEDVVGYSSMSAQSLYYMGTGKLKHKILSIEEHMGADKTSYPLKLLISEKKLEMATVVKDPSTGEMGTKELTVEGPTMFFSTDTLFEIDFEFANRCFMYYIDESTNQKALILKHLRFLETVEGQRYLKRANGFHHLHQNFQRLLKPVNVYNPYSEQLTFSILGDSSIRNQQKYLSLIKTITFLHQHQRPLKKDKDLGEYIEVTKEDIELAGKLLSEVMGKSTSELPPRTAYILEEINSYVKTKI
jgi:DNA primase/energy-coupling factor transporter ATP-binding protein EcfA2